MLKQHFSHLRATVASIHGRFRLQDGAYQGSVSAANLEHRRFGSESLQR